MMTKVETRSLVFGVVTLILVVIGSSFLVTAAAMESKKDEEDALQNPYYHPKDETLLLYHFESTSSTQDEAKNILADGGDDSCMSAQAFCVTATEQSNGRGTSGRKWMGARGNMFVTIGIPQQAWMGLKNVPLTLLPLRVGSLVARLVQELLDSCGATQDEEPPMVAVKWPNDVLVNEKKISGVLIESHSAADGSYWFLIGIGVNLAHAPEVPSTGPNNGRPSTCIQDICPKSSDRLNLDDAARQLGVNLAFDLNQWLQTMTDSMKAGEYILEEWKQWVDWDMDLVMRDTSQSVRMIDLLPDGRIQVIGEDGLKRTLVSDYFL